KARGASSRGDDRLHGRQAGVRHEFDFPLLEIPRKPARRPGVGPESVKDARVGEGFEVLFGGLEKRAIPAEVRVGTDRLLIISTPQALDNTRGYAAREKRISDEGRSIRVNEHGSFASQGGRHLPRAPASSWRRSGPDPRSGREHCGPGRQLRSLPASS